MSFVERALKELEEEKQKRLEEKKKLKEKQDQFTSLLIDAVNNKKDVIINYGQDWERRLKKQIKLINECKYIYFGELDVRTFADVYELYTYITQGEFKGCTIKTSWENRNKTKLNIYIKYGRSYEKEFNELY